MASFLMSIMKKSLYGVCVASHVLVIISEIKEEKDTD